MLPRDSAHRVPKGSIFMSSFPSLVAGSCTDFLPAPHARRLDETFDNFWVKLLNDGANRQAFY